jgi:hypothetical protein
MSQAKAYLTDLPEDPHAIVVDSRKYAIAGDGLSDDAPALQQAINDAATEKFGGVVFLPAANYAIHSTLNLWAGVRIISYGSTRARFILRNNIPFFKRADRRYLVHFRHFKNLPESDANNCTFFSALMGIDFVIASGYPNVAVARFRVAQHGLIRQCDFHLAEDTYAAIDQAGHVIEECRFYGGDYAISSQRTSASWPLCVRRCYFESQRIAALATSQAGLTLLNSKITHTAVACAAAPEAVQDLDRIYIKDCLFDRVETIVRRHKQYCMEQQITIENCGAVDCSRLVQFEKESSSVSIPERVNISRFLNGVVVHPNSHQGAIEASGEWSQSCILETEREIEIDAADGTAPAPTLPEVEKWQTLSTDTDPGRQIQDAIRKGSWVYLPQGRYTVRESIKIDQGLNLFGLHPGTTTLHLESSSRGFDQPAAPAAMIDICSQQPATVCGIGLRLNHNPGAIGLSLSRNHDTLVEDLYFYSRFKDRDVARERCSHSILLDRAGQTELRNIWSADVAAESGLCIQNTSGPVTVLMLSIEHHRKQEIILRSSSKIQFVALQTEENQVSPNALAVSITDSEALSFANTYLYRVMSHENSVAQAIRTEGCGYLIFKNLHVFSWGSYPFGSTLFDKTRNLWVRQREMTCLELPALDRSNRP